MKGYKFATILLAIVSLILLTTTIYYATNKQVKYETITQNDTIVIKSIDTITISKDKIIYRDVHILDTIYVKDSALVVEQKTYQDSISTVYFQGINAFIDSIEYRLSRDTIKVYTETTNTTIPKDNFWKNRFTISAGIFIGYGLTTHKTDAFVGIGGAIRLF